MRVVSYSYKMFCRVAALLLAFHFLNSSIDCRDKHPDFLPEDLRYNDIETFAEFIAEIVFNSQNAFDEHDEKDDESGVSTELHKYYFSNQALTLKKAASPAQFIQFNRLATQFVTSVSRDVIAPPPKA